MNEPRVQRPVGVVPSGSPRHVIVVGVVRDACHRHRHRWAKLWETLLDPQLECRDRGRLRSLGVDEVAVEPVCARYGCAPG
jgi:hypothetical protein